MEYESLWIYHHRVIVKTFHHDMTRITVLDTLTVSRAVPGHGIGTIPQSCQRKLDRLPDNFGFRVVRSDSIDCCPLPLVHATDWPLPSLNEIVKEVLTPLLSKQLCCPMRWREVILNVLASP